MHKYTLKLFTNIKIDFFVSVLVFICPKKLLVKSIV